MKRPLSGSPPARSVYTLPNMQGSDYISNIMINETISLTISSKGFVRLHSLPLWNVEIEKNIGKIIDGSFLTNKKIVLLLSDSPKIFNYELEIVQNFKKPSTFLERISLTSFQTINDIFYATSSNGNIIWWDQRIGENPNLIGLRGHPVLTSISVDNETVIVSSDHGKVYIVDPRMNRTLSVIDLSIYLNNQIPSILLDGISRRENSPWSLSFQFSNGTAGIYDLMEQKEQIIIDPPPFTECPKYAKLKPVFLDKYMIVGYSWSTIINVYKKKLKTTNISGQPIALATSNYLDGLFFSTYNGDIYQSF